VRRATVTVKRYEDHRGHARVTELLDSWHKGELVAVELVPFHDEYGYSGYELFVDGEKIGSIEKESRTVEHRSAGNVYVNSRYETKARYWSIRVPGHRDYGLNYDTRKVAVAKAVEAHDSEVRRAAKRDTPQP
jgi:hypothetical protein